jgi:hypothetical protein
VELQLRQRPDFQSGRAGYQTIEERFGHWRCRELDKQVTDDGGSVPCALYGFRGRAFGIGPIFNLNASLRF